MPRTSFGGLLLGCLTALALFAGPAHASSFT